MSESQSTENEVESSCMPKISYRDIVTGARYSHWSRDIVTGVVAGA